MRSVLLSYQSLTQRRSCLRPPCRVWPPRREPSWEATAGRGATPPVTGFNLFGYLLTFVSSSIWFLPQKHSHSLPCHILISLSLLLLFVFDLYISISLHKPLLHFITPCSTALSPLLTCPYFSSYSVVPLFLHIPFLHP